ncbi:CAIB/BAIF family enzyme [Auriculariales sp. MPI-PUGE-AT-0066]|nr:CAIB/BAIF family enzyme [Auriculariales sp. MPI-PUGE-AT-0066]
MLPTRIITRRAAQLAATRHGELFLRRALNSSTRPLPFAPPLAGIRVLDLTRVLAGPLSTMLLADLGADVIKVEEPSQGDDTRTWAPPVAPLTADAPSASSHLPAESAYFLAANRNKRSLTLDLKSPEGLKIARQLARTSDVLVENFVVGKLAKLGLGYEALSAENPGLVYVSITGYGQTGPYAGNAGYDVIIEGEAGLMHITGEPDGPPCKVGVAATDVATGLYAHGAVMAALLSRAKTGRGCWVDVNLFESQIAGLANIASNYLIAGKEASRHGTSHPSIVPYQVFPCSDGFIMIGAGNDRMAETILEQPELAQDERYATNAARVANRAELVDLIEKKFRTKSRDEWLARFKGLGIPHGPINNISQTFEHPQTIARGLVQEVQHPRAGPVKLVGPAVSYNGQRMPVKRPPPWLSQHTDEILAELGYDKETITDLRRKKVV